jgi:hypothetical protein
MSKQRLDKLEAVLAVHGSRIEAVAPLFAALLSIPFGERYPPLAPSPTQQRRRSRGGSAGGRNSAGTGWRNGPGGTAVCACSHAVPCRPWAFFTDSLCVARGRHRRAGERRGGWGRAG